MLLRTLRRLVLLAALAAGLAPPAQALVGDDDPACTAAGLLCPYDREPDDAWRAAAGLASAPNRWKGDGVTVASIDTGVVPNAYLGDRLLARVDFTDDHDGIDRFGHGTHLAGLIAGDEVLGDEAFKGAAPDAGLVSLKVAGWDGATDVSTVISALRWAVSHRDRLGLRVVSLAWGTDAVQSVDVDPLNAAVERAWDAGLVVVVSAGNGGPLPGTIAKPGDDAHVITVGAADTKGSVDDSDDTVADFSSRGPTPAGDAKPDLVAPGVSLLSTRAPGSAADLLRPEARFGASLFKGSGTSQAAAVVAGIAARMLDASPALKPAQVKGVLLATARGVPSGPGAGAGMVNAAAAVQMAADRGAASPTAPSPATRSTGTGSLAASRGSQAPWADLAGENVPAQLEGEQDALGRPWSPDTLRESWSAASWAASPWAPLVAEMRGSAPALPWSGISAPRLGVAPEPWGLRGPPAALDLDWAAKYWGAKYWGAKYWGTSGWQ